QLRDAARALHADGAIRGTADHPEGAPIVDLTWVLYLRRRQRDYQGFLDQLRSLYNAGAAVPDTLATLVQTGPAQREELPDGPQSSGLQRGAGGVVEERLLLPLPANEEQVQILRLAQR